MPRPFASQPSSPSTVPRSRWLRMLVVFVLVAAALQALWSAAHGSAVERAVIDNATVRTCAALINAISPDVAAQAVDSRIHAAGGGINVLNGCEGTEVLFLLVAAQLAYPATWRQRAAGMLIGTAAVFALNQLRLLILFYGLHTHRDWFSALHGLITPLALVLCTLLIFVAWTRWVQRSCPHR